MGFVGPVSRLRDQWVRPHDIEVLEDHEDGALQHRQSQPPESR